MASMQINSAATTARRFLAIRVALYALSPLALWLVLGAMFFFPGTMANTILMIIGAAIVAIAASTLNGWLSIRAKDDSPSLKKLLGTVPVLILMAAVVAIGIVASFALVAYYAYSARLNAVPDDLESKAYVSGFDSSIRYFPRDPEHVQLFIDEYLKSLELEKAYLATQGQTGPLPPMAILGISGGGDKGAFAAGFLNGWTKAGTRPRFKLVTGVSTGALIAPFAFLGPAFDGQLKEIYTSISLKDVAQKRSMIAIVSNDAVDDNKPLKNLVEKYFNQDILEAIAAEYAKGRLLLIGTVNLDARRPVIWNISAIAASRKPGALKLVQSLLIASSAIPGTFPPVMIDVEVDGRKYQEMHVDGNTANQVFVYPAAIRLKDVAAGVGIQRDRKLYIIRNARLDPEWAEVERRTLPIAFQAISTLIQYQGIGDLYRIYTVAQRDNVDFNLAYIPPTFKTPHKSQFDTDYMRSLFDLGYSLSEEGYSWTKKPPILVPGSE
jgi:predicted acylesterase/phospholipase RssA